jgi:hypothetical protein
MLDGRGLGGLVKHSRLGPIARLALVYVPFQPYRATLRNNQKSEQMFVAIDAVSGTLDLYRFDHEPGPSEIVLVETPNVPTRRLPRPELEQILGDRLRRTVFRRGFFKLKDFHLELEPMPGEICVPYWVSFRGRGAVARVEALDAVRRQLEGSKVRRLIEQWLAE